MAKSSFKWQRNGLHILIGINEKYCGRIFVCFLKYHKEALVEKQGAEKLCFTFPFL